MTTTGEAPPAADMVGLGKILLVVDGTPCVIIFMPVGHTNRASLFLEYCASFSVNCYYLKYFE